MVSPALDSRSGLTTDGGIKLLSHRLIQIGIRLRKWHGNDKTTLSRRATNITRIATMRTTTIMKKIIATMTCVLRGVVLRGVVKKRSFYGQADRKGFPPPLTVRLS